MTKKVIQGLLAVLILVILELVISNYTFFNIDKNKKNIQLDYVIVHGENSLFDNEDYRNVIQLEIPPEGLDCQNVCVYYNAGISSICTYKVATNQKGVIASTSFYYDKLEEKGKTKTRINLNATDVCYKVELYVDSVETADILKVVVNDTSICFNVWRFFLMLIIAFSVFGFLAICGITKYSYSNVYIFALIASILFFIFVNAEHNGEVFYSVPVDQIRGGYEELTYSLGHGSFVFVINEPEERLMNLEDIYDYTLRTAENVPYLFDDVYYEGHFSTYFGVTPVFEVMLPYYMISGKIISTFTVTMIYMVIFFFCLAKCYKVVVSEYFECKPNLNIYIFGYYFIIFISGVLQLWHGAKYHLATISAIVHVLVAVCIAYDIGKLQTYKRVVMSLCLGLCMGLIVLAKPSYIVYYPLIIALILVRCGKLDKSYKIIAIALIPLIGCAVFQILYNYSRYNNIFEFGTNYMTGACHRLYSKISLRKIIKELELVLVTPPKFDPNVFPFFYVQNCSSIIGWNTWHIADKILGVGCVPVFYLLLKPNILKKSRVTKIMIVAAICGACSVFIPIIMGFVNDEYIIELRLIFAMIVMIMIMEGIKANRENVLLYSVLCGISLMIMIPCGLEGNGKCTLAAYNEINVIFKNIFEFWG